MVRQSNLQTRLFFRAAFRWHRWDGCHRCADVVLLPVHRGGHWMTFIFNNARSLDEFGNVGVERFHPHDRLVVFLGNSVRNLNLLGDNFLFRHHPVRNHGPCGLLLTVFVFDVLDASLAFDSLVVRAGNETGPNFRFHHGAVVRAGPWLQRVAGDGHDA